MDLHRSAGVKTDPQLTGKTIPLETIRRFQPARSEELLAISRHGAFLNRAIYITDSSGEILIIWIPHQQGARLAYRGLDVHRGNLVAYAQHWAHIIRSAEPSDHIRFVFQREPTDFQRILFRYKLGQRLRDA
ncbi:hypothetical protein SDC9_111271 [bioreactor metagenome]|uniref:Uncharacterized protein n=1 Tax=bioreactor metagenome TaxID=1076179 RepID=A0A645BG19_9ZZZZ